MNAQLIREMTIGRPRDRKPNLTRPEANKAGFEFREGEFMAEGITAVKEFS